MGVCEVEAVVAGAAEDFVIVVGAGGGEGLFVVLGTGDACGGG